MIQRIQSVYLLVVTILIIICLCSPVGSYIGSDYSVSALTNLCLTMADGTKDYAPWALFVILLVVAVLAFGTIFLCYFYPWHVRMPTVQRVRTFSH